MSSDDAIKSFPLVWNEMCRDNWTILDGVEKYLFFLARTSVPEILPIIEKNSNFSNMYWDNIWDLEDKDITYQDFDVWRKQFDNKGPHRRRLIKYFLGRRDKEYFKNVSIDLLFEIMNKISDNPGEFDIFIKTFFPISKVDRYNKAIYQKDCVFNCNKMVEAISLGMEEKNNKIDYYTYLKMSIYLYGIIPNEIKKLWIKALQYCLNIIRAITNEYLNKEYISIVLKTNFADLYQTLDELMEDEEIRDLKVRCSNIDMYQETLSYLKKIWL